MKYQLIVAVLLLSYCAHSQDSDTLMIEKAHFNVAVLPQSASSSLSPGLHYLSPKKLTAPVFLVTYGIISLGNHELQNANKELRDEIRENNDRFHTGIDNYLQFTPATLVYALNAVGIKGTHNFRDRSIILGTSAAITTITVFALKKITHQLRPDQIGYSSFPSGHTAMAFSGAEFMQQEYRGHHPFLRYSGFGIAAGTGVLRMYNNRHWLSDVITGAGIGILSSKMSYWIFDSLQKKKNRNHHII